MPPSILGHADEGHRVRRRELMLLLGGAMKTARALRAAEGDAGGSVVSILPRTARLHRAWTRSAGGQTVHSVVIAGLVPPIHELRHKPCDLHGCPAQRRACMGAFLRGDGGSNRLDWCQRQLAGETDACTLTCGAG
jgi:hypothetical protein